MPDSALTKRASSPLARRVLGCVVDPRVRRRIEVAMRGHASLEWYSSFDDLRAAIETRGRMTTVVIGMQDAGGETATSFALAVRGSSAGTAIVACCDLGEELQSISSLAVAGVHDVLFIGMNDDGHSARTIVFGAAMGGAADMVVSVLGSSVPPSLSSFVETALRRPRELRRVADVAAALSVPRQTLGRWARMSQFVGPEELLMWIRLLLVAALLESTDRTLESIAYEMQYGSPTALRNRIREYSGLTATQLRERGLQQMMSAFRRRIDAVRADAGDKRGSVRVSALTG